MSIKIKDKTIQPRSLGTVCITISIPSTQLSIVDAICEVDGSKRSATIQTLIQRGLAHMKLIDYEANMTPEEMLEVSKNLFEKASPGTLEALWPGKSKQQLQQLRLIKKSS